MSTTMLPSLVAFVAVILMIPVALWLMKRTQSLRPGAPGALSMVAGLSVGPRERIAVVRAAGRYLVVGITGQSMTLLATLDEWPAGTDPQTGASPFSMLLDRVNKHERKDS